MQCLWPLYLLCPWLQLSCTSLLTANNENIKVVQELLRQASALITMDVYAQAKMADKRKAQVRVVEEIRPHQRKTA
jgi:integrase